MHSDSQIRILLVEEDDLIRALAAATLESALGASITQADSAREARKLLEKEPTQDCVVLGLPISGEEADSLFETLIGASNLKTILLTDRNASPDPAAFLPQRVRTLRKPFEPSELASLVREALGDKAAIEEATEGAGLVSVSVESLLQLGTLERDLFVKLSDRKFVKVIRGADGFGRPDAERFLSKGIERLYARRADCDEILEAATRKLLEATFAEEAHFDESFRLTAGTLQLIQDSIAAFGVTREATKLTRAAVAKTLETIRRNPSLFKIYEALAAQRGSYLMDHSVALAHVACGIASLQPWLTKKNFEQLTLAAFLHDIALTDPELARIQDRSELEARSSSLSKDDIRNWLEHSAKAAAIARQMKGAPAGADEIVSQHHEPPEAELRPLVCAFIIAHRIVSFMQEGGAKEDLPAFLYGMRERFRHGHFWPILESLSLSLARHAIDG